MEKATTKSKRKERNHSEIYGKVPPQNIEAEKAILGAILLEKGAFEKAVEILKPECFYNPSHMEIFSAMQALSNAGNVIDSYTLVEALGKKDSLELCGGRYYIDTLNTFVVSSAHIENHCHIVYEKYLKREMIRLAGNLLAGSYDESVDAFDLIEEHDREFQTISLQKTGNVITDLSNELVTRFKRIVELQKRNDHVTGIPSGFPALDRITHGWQNTDLIILAARPAVGKTAFALNIARNATRAKSIDGQENKVGLFSLEMSKGQLVDRVLSAESEIWLDRIMTGTMEESQLRSLFVSGVQPLSQVGIYIDDTPALNIFQFRAKARYMIRKFGVGLIIIDYLQLMSGVNEGKNTIREQEISNISRNLKKTAKELNIPIIALSQLNRSVENRKGENKVPQLSDLRESGAIEQDADMVMFMYRPEYYNIEADALGESTAGLTEISIAKHRNGSLATGTEAIKLRANLSIQKFYPWDGLALVKENISMRRNWTPISKTVDGEEIDFS